MLRCVFHRNRIRAVARRAASKCVAALLKCQTQHVGSQQEDMYEEALLQVRPDWDRTTAHDVVQHAKSQPYGQRFRFFDVVREVAVTECVDFVIVRYGVGHLNEHVDDIHSAAFDECAKGVPLEL